MIKNTNSKVFLRALVKTVVVCATLLVLVSFNYILDQSKGTTNNDLGTRQLFQVDEYSTTLVNSTSSSDEPDCEDINRYVDKCVFAKRYCLADGIFNYMAWRYCTFGSVAPSVVVFIGMLALAFYMLGTSTEDYFCPTLTIVSKNLKMSPSLAGVTLLAFGNGAPDVFSTIAGIQRGSFAIAMGELLGAGVFVTSIVVGLVGVVAAARPQKGSLLRDVGFYIVALGFIFGITYDGEIYVWEAAVLVAYYALYAITTLVMQLYAQKKAEVIVVSPTLAPRRDEPPSMVVRGFSVNAEPDDHSDTVSPIRPRRLFSDDDYEDEEAGERKPLLSAGVRGGGGGVGGGGVSVGVRDSPVSPTPQPRSALDLRRIYFGRVGIYVANAEKGEGYTVHKCVTKADVTDPVDLTRHHHHRKGIKEMPTISLDGQVKKPFLHIFTERLKKRSKWDKRSLLKKILYILTVPAQLAFAITIPTVRSKHWNKVWAMLWPLCTPLLAFLAFDAFDFTVKLGEHDVYLWLIIEGVGLLVSVALFFTSSYTQPPKYKPVFVAIAFFVSVIWIYLIAGEVVSLLQVLGHMFDISQAILGLTVMAWGNSVSDLAADVVVAKKGYPEMALSACFGGPLFNLLIGLGISFMMACVKTFPEAYIVELSPKMYIATGFLAASLFSTIILVPLNKFVISKKYGIYLIVLYLSFTVTSIVLEVMHVT